MLPELAGRLLGSADLYEAAGRRPWVSVNLVTSHDGFTLADLVSYAGRHNEANGEHNRDGHHDNLSANHGVEGPTDDPAIRRCATRQRLNLLATLLFAQGTPMLLMGDELGRSQHGNNNAYCQDNELSWVDWPSVTAEDRAFAELVGRLVELRRTHPLLRQTRYLHGEPTDAGLANVTWLAPEGRAMTPADWHDPQRRCFGLMLAGEGGVLAILLNADERLQHFALPRHGGSAGWRSPPRHGRSDGGGSGCRPCAAGGPEPGPAPGRRGSVEQLNRIAGADGALDQHGAVDARHPVMGAGDGPDQLLALLRPCRGPA